MLFTDHLYIFLAFQPDIKPWTPYNSKCIHRNAPLFWWLYSIPLNGYSIIYSSILLLLDIWVAFNFFFVWLRYNSHTITFTHLKFTIMVCSIFSIIQSSLPSIWEYFHCLKKPHTSAITPSPKQSLIHFLPLYLPILDTSYK